MLLGHVGIAARNCSALATKLTTMESPMRRTLAMAFLSFFVLAGAAALLSACNTYAGFGEDMSATGKSITDAGDDKK
jgi:predicted small secreted protein